MHEQNFNDSRGRLRRLYARKGNADATLGVSLALIAMLFIAGIVTAFIHAADTSKLQSAQINAAPPAETTGSGSTGP